VFDIFPNLRDPGSFIQCIHELISCFNLAQMHNQQKQSANK